MKKEVLTHTLDEPDISYLLSQIDAGKSKDQGRTSVILTAADCNVYQPYYLGLNDFESLRKKLIPWVRDKLQNDNLWIPRSVWALDYTNGEGARAHIHHAADYSLVWFLRADEGCGTIEFFDPEVSIEPTPGLALLFNAKHKHGVLPNVDLNARRTCMVFDIVDKRSVQKRSCRHGFYEVDEEFL